MTLKARYSQKYWAFFMPVKNKACSAGDETQAAEREVLSSQNGK